MSDRLRIIVTGLVAQYPMGGVTWDYLQYALGLQLLGHDVYYFEDTGLWPYNPEEGGVSRDCAFNVSYLSRIMERYALGDRWAYRFPHESRWFGLSDVERREVVSTADLLINISSSLAEPWEYRNVRRLAFIDSDPVFTQMKLARGQSDFGKIVATHDVLFSFGEAMAARKLSAGYRWLPTRQPVVLSEWESSTNHRSVFTTIMNWSSYKPVVFDGQSYGQKDVEFRRFMDLPARTAPTELEIAVNPEGKMGRTPVDLLRHKGWRVVTPSDVCPDMDSYQRYIQSSMAEWSVAKNGYVIGQAGWFSCRSACYLAAGRPVVLQDTGFSRVIPTGEGILPFHTLDEAVYGIREVEANYDRHSRAARAIAEEYFDSGKVLSRLLNEAMMSEVSK